MDSKLLIPLRLLNICGSDIISQTDGTVRVSLEIGMSTKTSPLITSVSPSSHIGMQPTSSGKAGKKTDDIFPFLTVCIVPLRQAI